MQSFSQTYGDTFNPLDIQGGGVYPLLEQTNLFCNFETAPVNKVSLTFSSQKLTPF